MNVAQVGIKTVPPIGKPGGTVGTYTFNAVEGRWPRILNVSGNIFAIAHMGDSGSDGWLYTLKIGTDGTIVTTIIDSFQFDASYAAEIDFIHVTGDYYAITNYRTELYIITLTIDSTGAIGAAVTDTLQIDSDGREPSICHVSGEIYAIAYRQAAGNGEVVTISIDASGDISASVLDSLTFDAVNGTTPRIIHVTGEIYAIAATGTSNNATVTTVEIDNAGTITGTVVATQDLGYVGYYPSILNVTGEVYVVAFSDGDNDGWIVTVTIDASGTITVVDSLEFDDVQGKNPDIFAVSNSIFGVVYSGPDNDGWIKTFDIDSSGNIGGIGYSVEFITTDCGIPNIITVDGNVDAIVYAGGSNVGRVSTIKIQRS